VLNLDDRTYEDLVAEALHMLPRYAPGWTNHNPSDPGITLVELLAYVAEQLIYRLNRVTRETKIRFVQLLCGAERFAVGPMTGGRVSWAELSTAELDEELRQIVRRLRRPERAVTADDYEYFARQATEHDSAGVRVVRASPFVRRNLRAADDVRRDEDAPGHVSIVVVPSEEAPPESVAAIVTQVREYLEPRRLLATRLHVVEPFFLWIRVTATLHMRPGAGEDLRSQAPVNALERLRAYFTPLQGGGPLEAGWPFGRALYLSEVYERLERVEGVDYVDDVDVLGVSMREEGFDERTRVGVKVGRSIVGLDSRLGVSPEQGRDRVLVDGTGRLVGIAIKPYELIRIASRVEDFSVGAELDGGPRRRAGGEP
jgi:hypothetical protein